MHMAIGSTIAAALTGLAAGTAVMLADPQTGRSGVLAASAAPADAFEGMRVQLAEGRAYIDQVHYGEAGSPVAFTVRIGAGSRTAARFVPTLPARVDAADIHIDPERGIALAAYGEGALLAQQMSSSVEIADSDRAALAGAPVITDRGHRFGEVERLAAEPGAGLVLMVRLGGAGGGIQPVPSSCAAFVRETGLVIVRTCNLGTI